MRRVATALAVPLLAVGATALAAEPDAREISTSVTGMFYAMRDQADFGVGIATLDRGPLHLEARYQYEAKDSASVFVGWTFSGGERLTYSVRPIVGVLAGRSQGVIPGVEASVAYGPVDLYVEAEYVSFRHESDDNFFYAWSELGYAPWEWLRVGIVGQRTRTVDSERDIQRGLFGQFILGPATVGIYAFNPDASSRYWIVSLGAKF
jgi:hypothetical protein